MATLATILFGVWWTAGFFYSSKSMFLLHGEVSLYIALLLLAVAGLVVVWWKELAACIYCLMFSATLGVVIAYLGWSAHAWILLGLPFLLSSVFFFGARGLAQHRQKSFTPDG